MQTQLAATTKDKKASLHQLKALNSKLRTRQRLISTINSEVSDINSDIYSLNNEISVLNKHLRILEVHYAQSVRYAYRHKVSQSLILFLFSSTNFNDAVRRMEYLKKYRDYRKTQANKIRQAKTKLDKKIAILNNRKKEKAGLLQKQKNQKAKIQQEQTRTDQMVTQLKGKEGKLLAQIRKNQRNANKIQTAIKAEIQREIEIARKKAEEEAKRKAALAAAEAAKKTQQSVTFNMGTGKSQTAQPPPSNETEKSEPETPTTSGNNSSFKLSLTPEVQALSNSFAANKGKLPWPVAKGYISNPYGRHPHPVYHRVMVENHGVDIATYPHEPIRAVFSGTVIKIANISGYVIMISHGTYFTVYTNLASVSVSVGEKITTKQTIGTAGVNADGDNMINFQIWKVNSDNTSSTVNPADWMAQ